MESDRNSEKDLTSAGSGVSQTGQCEDDWLPGTCDRIRSSLELLLHHRLCQSELFCLLALIDQYSL